ncbi:MAG TPA: NADP-dependent phosphogluconate dehydrogenase [Cyclobacteriaceae bacterium]|nr:NADP-dependent phosphogluconate dehydrogenase [Cyclobacteriaceae bacterium]
MQEKYIFGMIGLGTMGRNLLLNMGDHGFRVCGYDRDPQKVTQLEREFNNNEGVRGFNHLSEFVGCLDRPRAIMMLVPAGAPVDDVINELTPLLDKGDLLIDGGNSHFVDTARRSKALREIGLHFFGMGISGGEEGARNGPSMMPGGDPVAYRTVQSLFETVAAKVDRKPCVTYIGPGGSGHFVKMVHNGIEYAIMQIIAETYEMLHKGLGLQGDEIHDIFAAWNEGRLRSYLMEITRDILAYRERGTFHLLIEDIKDVARAKGTGKWTSQVAMEIQAPVPTIDVAVSMRDMSTYKNLRIASSVRYASPASIGAETKPFLVALEQALYFATIIVYAQGMHLLSRASEVFHYNLKLDKIALIWRGGCIIRSAFLEEIFRAYQQNPALLHLLLDQKVASLLKGSEQSMRTVVSTATASGVAIPAYASALSYFDTIRSEHMPTNLIQAQRDYFGAHTYERVDKEGVFHTDWLDREH